MGQRRACANDMAETRDNRPCSFCGKSRQDVRKLVAEGDAVICDECIALCHDILLEQGPRPEGRRLPAPGSARGRHLGENPACAFCGMARQAVQTVIAGPSVTICEACVGACYELVAEDVARVARDRDARIAAARQPTDADSAAVLLALESVALLIHDVERHLAEPGRRACPACHDTVLRDVLDRLKHVVDPLAEGFDERRR